MQQPRAPLPDERSSLPIRSQLMTLSQTGWFLLVTLVPSCLVAWVSTSMIRRRAAGWGLVDHPAARKVHLTTTPLGGGLGVWLGVVSPFAVGTLLLWLVGYENPWIPAFVRPHLSGLSHQLGGLWTLLGAGTILMLLGLFDDLKGIRWQFRILVQIVVATTCVIWQDWRLTLFLEWQPATWFLSVLWIVGLVNSFNMLDNMDGLSGGVATIAASMLAAVLLLNPDPSTHQPQMFVAGLLLVLAGGLLGFLWHNRPPARIFMGDAGSYFVGFCIATSTLLATFTSYRGSTPHAVLAPLCVLAVPIYDMVTVIWIRLRQGQSPFQADKNHFSHRLVELGFTPSQAVLTIYLTTACCGLAALLLHRVDGVGALLVALLVVCVLAIIALIESTARRRLRQ